MSDSFYKLRHHPNVRISYILLINIPTVWAPKLIKSYIYANIAI